MKRVLLLLIFVLLAPLLARADEGIQGWCEDGGQVVITSGLNSTTLVQASYPQCQVSVLLHGGGAATIYSDNVGTVMSNPFTASMNGQWQFYVPQGRYDVVLSGGGLSTTVTFPDIIAFDPAQFGYAQCALSFSTTPVFNAGICSLFSMTLTGNVAASNITGALTGQEITISLCQDATGGRIFVWPASFYNPPTVTPYPNACEQLSFVLLADGRWHSIATGEAQVFNQPTLVTGNFTAIVGQNLINAFQFNNIVFVDGSEYPKTAAGIIAADASMAGVPAQITVTYPGSYCDTQVLAPSHLHTLMFAPGIYNINIAGADSSTTNVTWAVKGMGPGPTILMGCPNSHLDVITTQHFSTLTSSASPYSTTPGYVRTLTGNTFGTYRVEIGGLVLDGNRAAETGSIGISDCIRMYGRSWYVHDNICQNPKGDGYWLEFNAPSIQSPSAADNTFDRFVNNQAFLTSMNGTELLDDVNTASGYQAHDLGTTGTTTGWGMILWGSVENAYGWNIFAGTGVSPYSGALDIKQGGGIAVGSALQLDGGCWGVLYEHNPGGATKIQGEIGASRSCGQTAIGLELDASYFVFNGEINAAGTAVKFGSGTSAFDNLTVILDNNTNAFDFTGDAGDNVIVGVATYTSGSGQAFSTATPPSPSDLFLMTRSNGVTGSQPYIQIQNLALLDSVGNLGLNLLNAYTSVAAAINGNLMTFQNNAGSDDTSVNLVGLRGVSTGTHRYGTFIACNTLPVTTSNFEQCLNLANYHATGIQLQSGDTNAVDINNNPPADDTKGFIVESNHANNAIVYKVDHQGNVAAASIAPANGFSGTKTAGSCVLTITSGVITNVTGC